MNEKKRPITKTVLYVIIGEAIILVLACLLVSTFFFRDGAVRMYEEMDRSITGASYRSLDEADVRELAVEVNEVVRATGGVNEAFESDPGAYYSCFADIQNSELYQKVWTELNTMREGTKATAVDFVLLYPETDTGVYIMDASNVNVLPCGEIFELDLGAYEGHPGKEFDSFVSVSQTYGNVRTDGIPVYIDESEGIYAYLLADIPLSAAYEKAGKFLFQTAVIAVIFTIICCIGVVALVRRRVVRPLTDISEGAKDFASNYKSRSDNRAETHVFGAIDGGRVKELSDLTDSLRGMETEINSYIRDIDTLAADKARISTELDLARDIQSSMVPSMFPPFPERMEFDLYASMEPAKEVGGDFYDFFLVDDDHLAMVMADVSGKGIPAALFMMIAKILIKNRTMQGGTPADVLYDVNNQFCEGNTAEMFVTCWLGILTLSSGRLIEANAGHENPALRRAGGFTLIERKHGLVLGGLSGTKYINDEFTMDAGDALFIYTDGVTEASDADRRLFGTERMLAALDKGADGTAAEIISAVRNDVNSFTGDAPQFDDLTMLAIKYFGNRQ